MSLAFFISIQPTLIFLKRDNAMMAWFDLTGDGATEYVSEKKK